MHQTRISVFKMDPEALKLAEQIEASRHEIAKLQERVRQLVARRGKRAELVKSSTTFPTPESPTSTQPTAMTTTLATSPTAADGLGKELTVEEGLNALKKTPMSEVRLIAFKHGAVVFLFANERTLTVRMDDRGPKPLLDLLTANDSQNPAPKVISAPKNARSRA
jgi:hypothetical protein